MTVSRRRRPWSTRCRKMEPADGAWRCSPALPPVLVVVFMQRQFVRGKPSSRNRRNRAMAQVHPRRRQEDSTTTRSRSSTASTWRSPMSEFYIVIVGPLVDGKSTLLRMVAASSAHQRRPGRDQVAIAVVNELEPKDRDIAMAVFQTYALYPHRSVYRGHGATAWKIRRPAKDDIDAWRGKASVAKIARASSKLLELPAAPVPGGQRQLRRRDGPRHRARAGGLPVQMSHYPTSTPSCACRCGSRSKRLQRLEASRHLDAMSPTTRSRR